MVCWCQTFEHLGKPWSYCSAVTFNCNFSLSGSPNGWRHRAQTSPEAVSSAAMLLHLRACGRTLWAAKETNKQVDRTWLDHSIQLHMSHHSHHITNLPRLAAKLGFLHLVSLCSTTHVTSLTSHHIWLGWLPSSVFCIWSVVFKWVVQIARRLRMKWSCQTQITVWHWSDPCHHCSPRFHLCNLSQKKRSSWSFNKFLVRLSQFISVCCNFCCCFLNFSDTEKAQAHHTSHVILACDISFISNI